MGAALTSAAIEMEFSGVGAGWTNVSSDVSNKIPVTWGYGVRGSGPTDLVASPGNLRFAMRNPTSQYSPSHASKRAGFNTGIRVRLTLGFSGVTYYKFIGVIDAIDPNPGKMERVSHITVVDWMEEASRQKVTGVPTTLSTDAGAVITAILAAMPIQPNAVDIDAGSDTFAYSMVNGQAEQVVALAEFQRILMSEVGGRLVIRGGTSAATAGRLTFFNRGAMVSPPLNVSQGTFTDSMNAMTASYSRKLALNVFRAQMHPRTADVVTGEPQVLFILQEAPSIDPGETLVISGDYTDPSQPAAKVSGFGMIPPANGVDILINSTPNSSGTDLYANFTVVADYGGGSVRYEITNNGGVTGFVSRLQASGYGIYDYEPVSVEVRDATSVAANGENPVDMDLWYQQDSSFAKVALDYLIPFWKDPTTHVPSVSFHANGSSTLMTAALAREPGDRVTIVESTTGVNNKFVIQAVDYELRFGKMLTCTWTLSQQTDSADYWFLEEGGSALGTNTLIAL